MLISCPYCGTRDLVEFSYQGDDNRSRPEPSATDQQAWNSYTYDRLNPLGEHKEIWQHTGGCRAHLAVTRNTLTHAISKVSLLRGGRSAAVESAAS